MKRTEFLFAMPSSLRGVSRILDLGGTGLTFNFTVETDKDAMKSDWDMTGLDMRGAIYEFERANKRKLRAVTESK